MISTIALYSGLVFLTAAAGGLFPLLIPKANEDHLKLFVSLGAGILIGMSMLHILPEASHLIPDTFGIWLMAGFLVLLILERFIMVHACEEHGCNYHTVGLAAFVGLTVHGLIEGLALGSSLMASDIGPLVLVGILSHKAPAGMALTSILRLSDRSSRRIIAFILGVSLSVPAGCLLAYLALSRHSSSSLAGALLAASAGTFLYIAACDLLPELHRKNGEKFKRMVAFLVGIVISFASGHYFGHHH